MDKNQIAEVVKQFCREEDKQPIAVYLRGSRLKKINTDQSDYDLVVIVDSSSKELLSDKLYLKTKKIDNFDIQLWSVKTLYQHIMKQDVNTFEILLHDPLIFNDKCLPAKQLRYFELISDINNNAFKLTMKHKALPKFYYASRGILTKNLKRDEIDMKAVSTGLSYFSYVYNILQSEDIDAETAYSLLAEKTHNDKISDAVVIEKALHEIKSWQNEVTAFINNSDNKMAISIFDSAVKNIFESIYEQHTNLMYATSSQSIDDYRNFVTEFTDDFSDSIDLYYDNDLKQYVSEMPIDYYQSVSGSMDNLVNDDVAESIIKMNNCKVTAKPECLIISKNAQDLLSAIIGLLTVANLNLQKRKDN